LQDIYYIYFKPKKTSQNGKFFLFSGFNRDKMVVWGF